MKRWLFWLYYANPFSYGTYLPSKMSFVTHTFLGFGGLMDNEFMRTNVGV